MNINHLPSFKNKTTNFIKTIEELHPKSKSLVEGDLKEIYLNKLLGTLNECIYANIVSYDEPERKYREIHSCLDDLLEIIENHHPEYIDDFLIKAEVIPFKEVHRKYGFKQDYLYTYQDRKYYLQRLNDLDTVLVQYYH